MSVDPRLSRRKVTVSLALSLLAGRALGSSASAQERGKPLAAGDRITRLERQLEDLRQALKMPGISAAIVKDRKLQWSKGFGSADTENKIPATPGSCSSYWAWANQQHVIRRYTRSPHHDLTYVGIDSKKDVRWVVAGTSADISTAARRTRVGGVTARCDTPAWWLD